MVISPAALRRLTKLLATFPDSVSGLRFEGHVGTCRGSAPIFKPLEAPLKGDQTITVDGFKFFVPKEKMTVFMTASLDVDRAFMGKGFFLTWPHMSGCDCDCH
ncbi:MAG: hypothetical protein RRC34_13515 [Lentisphaeria bacterium]|nr:hypothetical protein [Lentisphaeria bacterium]